MVVVPKGDGSVRICVDLTKLNQAVRRERHLLPSVEQSLAMLENAKFFSKIDANSGFWQIELDKPSAQLTTFITPFGRFHFNRLPFGINSAPEHFQRRMSQILADLEGAICLIDDVLIYGKTQEEHDTRLTKVLQKLQAVGLTLNSNKCEFSKSQVKFLGQVINSQGVSPDPDKTKAILQMEEPKNVTDVRRYLGMINQLSKFSPDLSSKTKPLRDLLSTKNQWAWGPSQQKAFADTKAELSSPRILALYNPAAKTTVSADASPFGLGGVLSQKQSSGQWQPVSYISRSLTSVEQRYAQVEKECLAVTWACERFADLLIGKEFLIETDHKPLLPLLTSKNLDELPVRIQRYRMRLMRFQYTVTHIPGPDLKIADALSRAPLPEITDTDKQLQVDTDAYVAQVIQGMPATPERLKQIRQAQEQDNILQQLIKFCTEGWPHHSKLKGTIKLYKSVASELSVQEGLLLRGSRIVIPPVLQKDMLAKIHTGHLGITKCQERAKQSVWWPRIRQQIEEMVQKCLVCSQYRRQNAEPLIPTSFPDYPWQKVAADLFTWKNNNYLILVDYYSRYMEMSKLSSTSSMSVIQHIKSIFARHGIPETFVSDNGPQFSSSSFTQFATDYGFYHQTSSPNHPQSNGEAERAVQTVKSILNKAEDPYLGLLAYRVAPLANGYSPAELLMGRKPRSTVPMIPELYKPKLLPHSEISQKEHQYRSKQQSNFNKRHRTHQLKPLKTGDQVWIPELHQQATVLREVAPRSYLIQTPRGRIRRNRQQLTFLNATVNTPPDETRPVTDSVTPTSPDDTPHREPPPGATITRSGRVSKPPDRLNY